MARNWIGKWMVRNWIGNIVGQQMVTDNKQTDRRLTVGKWEFQAGSSNSTSVQKRQAPLWTFSSPSTQPSPNEPDATLQIVWTVIGQQCGQLEVVSIGFESSWMLNSNVVEYASRWQWLA